MSETNMGSDGVMLPIDDLAVTLVSVGGFTTTLTVQYPNAQDVLSYYTQTFTNDGTYYTGWSRWILGAPV